MTAEPRLDASQQAYQAFLHDLPELYRTHPEQWAAYQGGKRIGLGKERHVLYQELFSAGLQRGEFVIFGIVPQEEEV